MTTQEAATVRYGDSDSARDRLLRLQEDLEEIQRHAARLVEELDQLHAQVSEWWVATVLQTEWLRLHDAGNDTETVFACLCADCLSPIDIRVAHYQYEPNPVSMHKFIICRECHANLRVSVYIHAPRGQHLFPSPHCLLTSLDSGAAEGTAPLEEEEEI